MTYPQHYRPDGITPAWSRALAEVRMSPYWSGLGADGYERRDTFIEQASGYASYDDLPGDLQAIYEAAYKKMGDLQ